MLINYWVANWLGLTAQATTFLLFLISILKYEDDPNISIGLILTELLIYLSLTVGMWLLSVYFLLPDTLLYLQLSKPAHLRSDYGNELNPEGTENVPIGAFYAL